MVKVNIPTSSIKTKLGINKNGATLKYATQRAREYMDKYVPMRTGDLRGKSVDLSTPGYVIYEAPYARYVYRGILYVDPKTGSPYAREGVTKVPTNIPLKYHYISGKTGAYWDKKMMNAEGDKYLEDIAKYIGERVK